MLKVLKNKDIRTQWYLYPAAFAAIAVVVFFAYRGVGESLLWFDGYHTIGKIYYNSGLFLDYFTPSLYGAFHYNPLGASFRALLFKYIEDNVSLHMLISLLMHIAASFVVFLIAKKIFKKYSIGFLAGLLFAVSAVNYETIAWPSTYSNSIGGPLLAMLSFLFFLYWSDSNKSKWFWLSLTFAILAPFFLETAFVISLLIPVFAWFFTFKRSFKKTFKKTWPFLLVCFIYLGMRLGIQFSSKGNTVSGKGGLLDLIKDYPESFSWMFPAYFVTVDFIKELANSYRDFFIGTFTERSPYRPVAAILAWLFLFSITISSILLFWKKKKLLAFRIIYFTLFILIASAPFLAMGRRFFTPGSERFYYLGLLGAVLMIVLFIDIFINQIKLRFSESHVLKVILTTIVLALIFAVFSIPNINYIQAKIDQKNKSFNRQKIVLDKLDSTVEHFPDKSIMLFTSNAPNNYAKQFDPGWMFGPGYIFLLRIEGNNPEYYTIYKHGALGGIDEQRYDAAKNGNYFGFFTEYDLMLEAVKENNVPIENVYALSYPEMPEQGTEAIAKDVTDEIRARLEADLADSVEISKDDYSVQASENNQKAVYLSDDDLETSWNSGRPYRPGEMLEFIFKEPVTVSQVDLLTTSEEKKNLFAGGYKVEGCDESGECTELFVKYSLPSNEDGLVHMSFAPTEVKKLIVTQLGKHGTSYWTISEVRLFAPAD